MPDELGRLTEEDRTALPSIEGADDASSELVVQEADRASSSAMDRFRRRVEGYESGGVESVSRTPPGGSRFGIPEEAGPAGRARPGVEREEGPEDQSTVGRAFRNVAEIPGQAVAGAVDAVKNTISGLEDLNEWLTDQVPEAVRSGVPDLKLLAVGLATRGEKTRVEETIPELPAPRTGTGAVVRPISRFIAGFIGGQKVLGAAGMAPSTLRAMAAGGLADLAVFDGQEKRLSNLLQEIGVPDNVVTDFLAADPDDNEALGRLKNVVEGLGLGLLTEGLLRTAKAIRSGVKALKGAAHKPPTPEEATAALRAEFGEVTERDFMIFGDADAPLVEVTRAKRKMKPRPTPEGKLAVALGEVLEKARAAQPRVQRIGEAAGPEMADVEATVRSIETVGDFAEAAVQTLRRPKFKEGQSLTQWLRSKGGLIDQGGELRAQGITSKTSPGLINNKAGMNLDDAARAAWEEGYLDDFAERPTIDEFLQALDDDFRKINVRVRADDADRAAAEGLHADFEEALSSMGITRDMSNDQIKRALIDPAGDPARSLDDLLREQGELEAAGDVRLKVFADEEQGEVFINFNRIEAGEDVKTLMAETANAMKGSIDEARRGVQTNEQTAKLAEEMGLSVGDLLSRRKGEPLNAETALAARRLMVASADKLLETAQKAAGANAGAVDQFNFRRMMALHHAIQKEVVAARTETARALQSWAMPAGGSVERARAVADALDAMGGAKMTQELARRLAVLGEAGARPQDVAKFADRGWGAVTVDAVREVWINGLLSSPKTHIVNISSNTFVAAQQIAERKAAEIVSGSLDTTGGVAVGEAAAMAGGLIDALPDALRLSWKALRTGEVGRSLNKIDVPRPGAFSTRAYSAARGKSAAEAEVFARTPLGRAINAVGAVTRAPGLALGAEDEFFKTIGYRMELRAQAIRTAAQEGLTGQAAQRRIAEVLMNPPEHIRINAADAALYNTFTNRAGWFARGILNLRNGQSPMNPLPFIIPFVRTPANIARYAFERTPLAPLVGQWRADIRAGGAVRDIALARTATGTLAMMWAADMADRGYLTGRLADDPGVRGSKFRQGQKPYSYLIGDRWWSYNRTDPLGMTLGLAADIAESIRRGEVDEEDVDEWYEVSAMGITAISQVTLNKTYLRGMAELSEVLMDPDRHTQGYVSNLAASFLPGTAMLANIERAVDPTVSDVQSPADAAYARIWFLSDQLPRKRDLWGELYTNESGLGRVYDFLSPISASPVSESPIDAEIQRLNADVRRMRKRATFNGADINFKQWPHIFEAYVQLAGNAIEPPEKFGKGSKAFLDEVVTGQSPYTGVYRLYTDGHDGGKAAFIKNTISDYRRLARSVLMGDRPDIERQPSVAQVLEGLPEGQLALFRGHVREQQAAARARAMPFGVSAR
ncbi:MAG: hypothetical protein QNJ94_18580 [Alphaproteobacteria bacterium]|nr:hypothetical protein [Alphaproteobacteria bacterium]